MVRRNNESIESLVEVSLRDESLKKYDANQNTRNAYRCFLAFAHGLPVE